MIGQTISRYRIVEKLGGGGMGVVYRAEALLQKVDTNDRVRMARACFEGRPLPEGDPVLRGPESSLTADRDPEPKYVEAARLSFCGYTDIALHLLRRSVEGNYLQFPAMDSDPLLAKVRDTPEFARIRALAIEKQKRLLAHLPS